MTLVLGVDPGSRVTGYGLVEKKGSVFSYVAAGHISPPASLPFYKRLHVIYCEIVKLIQQYHPSELSIEDMFYGKNVQSALKLGHARGSILIAALEHKLDVYEYTPLNIKKAVVGYGNADKSQVHSMVRIILGLHGSVAGLSMDASDALAAAICHHNSNPLMSAIAKNSL